MRSTRWHGVIPSVILAGGVWLFPGLAVAHVGFTAPAPNTQLVAGTQANLEWVDQIPHTTTAYTLEFFASSSAKAGLIAGDISPTTHSYGWSVPKTPCTDCFLRVTQVNDGTDYSGDLAISIVTSSGGGPDGGAGPELGGSQEASGGGCAISQGEGPGTYAALVVMSVVAACARRRRSGGATSPVIRG